MFNIKDNKRIEKLVLERYVELAGLVRDGQMVNKDKESRARQYVVEKEKFTERILEESRTRDNAKYGEFILQTNDVLRYLVGFIFLRSFTLNESFKKHLEESQMGALISYLNVCARIGSDFALMAKLKDYKKKRDALAHKMFTDKKLTVNECEKAIKAGDKIISYLTENMKPKHIPKVEGTDKISDFRHRFNDLLDVVTDIQSRLKKLEKKKPSN